MDKVLEDICGGWSTMHTLTLSAEPAGGMIDFNHTIKKWFVIFNDDRESHEWFDTRDAAVEHFCEVR